MNKRHNWVGIVIHGFRMLNNIKDVEIFQRMLKDLGSEFIPKRIGMYEPFKTPYTDEAVKNMWLNSPNELNGIGSLHFQSKTLSGYITWSPDNSNRLSFDISLSALKDHQRLINFSKQAFLWLNGVYGEGFHFTQIGVNYTPGYSFDKCIGGITWMTLFGLPYVSMFGKETIETAPCMVEEFAENCFMLLTSKEPREPDEEILERQQKVKLHLGEDAFYKGNIDEITPENKKIIYRAPDLSGYWKKQK